MNEYKELYYKLFNRITDVITELQELQQEAEEAYISKEELPAKNENQICITKRGR